MRKIILVIFAIPVICLSLAVYLVFFSTVPATTIIGQINKSPDSEIEIKYGSINGSVTSGFSLTNFSIEDKQSKSPLYSIDNFAFTYDNLITAKYSFKNLTKGQFSINEIIAEGGVLDIDLIEELSKRNKDKSQANSKAEKKADKNNEKIEEFQKKYPYYNIMIKKISFKNLKFIKSGKEYFMPEIALDEFKISTDEIYLKSLEIDHQYLSLTSKLVDPENYDYEISLNVKQNSAIHIKEDLKVNSQFSLGKDIPFKISLSTEGKELNLEYDANKEPTDIYFSLNNFTTDKWFLKTTYINIDKFVGKIEFNPEIFNFDQEKSTQTMMMASTQTILHPEELYISIMGRQFYLPEENIQPIPIIQASLLKTMLQEVNTREPASSDMQTAKMNESDLSPEEPNQMTQSIQEEAKEL
ncbi:hypothetical protein N9N67_02530 [Bacteriovoracaceae bacterium]|nr:hypothetical protein [Bacteriovoracaceae bacterium]